MNTLKIFFGQIVYVDPRVIRTETKSKKNNNSILINWSGDNRNRHRCFSETVSRRNERRTGQNTDATDRLAGGRL